MPTSDATLLPPVPPDPGSTRRLDEIGAVAVLGAMVQQRRASRPAPEEISPDSTGEVSASQILVDDEDDGSADETQPRRVPQHSDAFVKVR